LDLEALIHPVIAASAVLMVVTAYLLKTRKKLYFRLHYAAGILAFSLTVVAFPLGFYEVLTSGGPSLYPEALVFHTVNFVVVVGLTVFQGALGMSMLLFGRARDDFRSHKRVAKYVLIVFLLQGALGLLTLYGILPYVLG
jgi:hypothetical protein